MNSVLDYKRYKEENSDFLNMLEKEKSIVYGRLYDVFKVLGYIELQYDLNKMDSDLETIFEAGFSFLYVEIEIIKVMYRDYFKSKYQIFSKYDVVINYFLYLNDLSSTLEEEKGTSKLTKAKLKKICEKVDNFLLNKGEDIEKLLSEVEFELTEIGLKSFPLTTIEIFGLISEELEI